VARGSVRLGGTSLGAGDAARLTGAGPTTITVLDGADVLAWEMRTGLPVG
jgi:hypothetical protein